MSDFSNAFIGWFITLVTVASIAGLVWLIRWTQKGKTPAPGEQVGTMGHVWDDNLEEMNNPLPRWWLYMFYITLVFGAGYLLLYPGLGTFGGLLGWTSLGEYQAEMQAAELKYGPLYERYRQVPVATLVNDAEAMRIGERLFSTYCTTCHGSDARGVRGFPNLRDGDWLYGGTPEDIQHTITAGRQGAMPPWAALLGEEGVFQAAEYVRSLGGRDVDPLVAAKGREIYQQNCALCHGPDGHGNTQLGAPNLSDNIWLYGGSQKQIMESIANGRNGRMPAHGEFLGEAKVHLLATYVFGLRLDTQIGE